ncbi:MAG TPA: translation initiation factor IF-3 [bacterium]|nr:translation initiation factor IF-3 [bacterium]HPS30460.1 translation initiation factor IF-3 [bacterium]
MIKNTKAEATAAPQGVGLVNETIKSPSMRVINPAGEVLGVLTKREALEKAREFGLDLVCVSPNTDPVVCKIMDYGKHLYKMKKKAKKAKANQVVVEIKELKIRPNTDTHDLMTKVRQAKKFLDDGNKVKFTVFFRGREIMFAEKALENLNLIVKELGGEDALQIELDSVVKNKRMTMMVSQKN